MSGGQLNRILDVVSGYVELGLMAEAREELEAIPWEGLGEGEAGRYASLVLLCGQVYSKRESFDRIFGLRARYPNAVWAWAGLMRWCLAYRSSRSAAWLLALWCRQNPECALARYLTARREVGQRNLVAGRQALGEALKIAPSLRAVALEDAAFDPFFGPVRHE